MDPWTAALTCTVCGEPISTERPPEFPWQGRVPGTVLWQKYQVHLQKYHPDYFALNMKIFFAGAILLIFGVFTEAIVSPFGITVLQALPFATPLLLAIPLFRWYRKSVANIRSKWSPGQEPVSVTPAGFWKTPGYKWQMNRCHICGEEVALSKGLNEDMQEHRKNRHPQYYRWSRRAYLVVPPMLILFVVEIAGLVLRLRILSSGGLVGMVALLVIVITLGIWGERKYSRLTPA
jgi:hypothetical protein